MPTRGRRSKPYEPAPLGELDAEALRTPVDARRTRRGSSHHAPAPPPRPTPVPPPPPRTSARRSGPRCAAPVRRGVQSPGDTHGRERRSPAGTRGAPRRAGRNSTRRHGWEHGINHRDMFFPQDPLLRQVPGQPTPLQRHVPQSTHGRERRSPDRHSGAPRRARRNPSRRDGYEHRIGSSDMCPPQDRLLRHVPGQPMPAPATCAAAGRATATCARPAGCSSATCAPGESATATCTPPADPASATCATRRTGYCDMYPPSRMLFSDMCRPENRLLRHVTCQPIPPQRHVPPAGRPTATCDPSADTAPATCAPGESATATCDPPADPASATCASRRTCYCDM